MADNYPKDWMTVAHQDISDINPKLPNNNLIDDLEISFIPMKAVQEVSGNIDISETKKYKDVKKGYTPFINDDIIFAKITPCMENGKVAIVRKLKNSIGFGSTEFHVSRLHSLLSRSLYFYYFIQELFRREARRNMTGSAGQLRVPTNYFKEVLLPLPPAHEQNKIVELIEQLFSELDNAVENLKKSQEQLKIYRQAVLEYAFKGRLTNKLTESGVLPNGWQNINLGDICVNVEYGSAAKSKKAGEIPVLRMGNIQNGKLDWDDLVYTDDKKEISKYLLKKNDILFNRTNSPELVGKTAIYTGERPAIFAGYLIRINYIESKIDPKYLTYYLNSHSAKKYGSSVKSFGVNQSNINGTKLKTYPLPLAPVPEQKNIVQEIESRFSVCDNIEKTIEEGLQQAEALRQSILKHAFEGKLTEKWRKEHPELISGENSAKALLEKIKAEREALKPKRKRKS